MVKPNNLWLFPPHNTWQLPNPNCMSTSLDPVRPGCLPAFPNPGIYANMMMPGISVPCIPSLNTQQSDGAQGLPHNMSPPCQNFVPATGANINEDLSASNYGRAGEAALNAVPRCQQRFVILDHSGDRTRLIYSSLSPAGLKPSIAASKPTGSSYLHCEEHGTKVDKINLTVPKLQEVSDENLLSGEENEMHEDTEEINALLYSDDDYCDDNDSDDDEVASTGHSPTLIGSCRMKDQVEDISEAVTNSNGQSKRQKLLDSGYKKPPLMDSSSSTKMDGVALYDYDDAKSSYGISQNEEDKIFAAFCSKQSKRDKVRTTLKILESIIPGAKDKDPLLVLDIAIEYLESLKLKAKTLTSN